MKISISLIEKIYEKTKKVIKKYNKITFSDSTESLSKFKNFDKYEFEEREKVKDFYGHYLSIFKIHIFVNMQLHNYFLRRSQPIQIENINLRFFLLNIFETSNEFYKTANINKILEIKCEIRGDFVDLIPNDYQILEHIFLILFFSLISKNLIDKVEMLCELENNENHKILKFNLIFFKEKILIPHKKNIPNECALYLTDKIFESTNLSESALFQKILENLKKYNIYEIALNTILFNLKKINCMDFQIQDLSLENSENQIITSVSFVLPIITSITRQNSEHNNLNLSEYESNFLKFNSFKFVHKNSFNFKFCFVLDKVQRSQNENILEEACNMIKSCDIEKHESNNINHIKECKFGVLSPNSHPNGKTDKKQSVEEFPLSDREKTDRSSVYESKQNKKPKLCNQVMKLSMKMKNENKCINEENKLDNSHLDNEINLFNKEKDNVSFFFLINI